MMCLGQKAAELAPDPLWRVASIAFGPCDGR